ncbi:MAG TPA: DUF6127 family protein [Sphingomonadales bacterium]|nr:DUF6127 family protein [Sphingomonadales bacterium]
MRTAANPKGRRVSLRKLIEAASEEGAARALAKLGLHDDTAGKDIRELRDLLEAWRETRKTAWRTVVRWVTSALIILILAGLAIRLKLPFFNG